MSLIEDARNRMLEHSKAKVELYRRYLSIYLNVLKRVQFINKIYLYDLFAGEGEYGKGEFGSPIESLNCIKNHYFANNKHCKGIQFLINDSRYSDIEPGKLKIHRIEEIASTIFQPPNLKIIYNNLDYSQILPLIIQEINNLSANERALIFIDPWGYKEINPKEIKSLFDSRNVEIILFLPISFMYRFSEKALTDDFPEGKALQLFFKELLGNQKPNTLSVHDYINDIKEKFVLLLETKYIATFKIQRDKTNYFCLFFFSHNKKGFQKMIDAKWSVDKESGKGFRLDKTLTLFGEDELQDYESKLFNYISIEKKRTNQELLDFGYENELLPKHTTSALNKLLEKNLIERISADNKPVRGFYISDEPRTILINKRK